MKYKIYCIIIIIRNNMDNNIIYWNSILDCKMIFYIFVYNVQLGSFMRYDRKFFF